MYLLRELTVICTHIGGYRLFSGVTAVLGSYRNGYRTLTMSYRGTGRRNRTLPAFSLQILATTEAQLSLDVLRFCGTT